MLYLLLGSSSFLFFILYDLNDVKLYHRFLKSFFAIGSSLLLYSTAMIVYTGSPTFSLSSFGKIISGIGSLFSLVLLIYTLFFALPWKKTYLELATNNKVVDKGFYALCRHPGVLWFIAFYFFTWLFTGVQLLLFAGMSFSILNIIYISLQEKYFFPRLFMNYGIYQQTTPFLFPTPSSIKKCCSTFATGEEITNEL
ncbi:MAG: hypothetical protein WCI30_07360 [Clostridia bacterium]